jgi:DNA-binding transcriptional MerR regulator
VTERSHLAIGEVLSLLRDEFPDVTISKIRFLESQGLVDPERTPSGYRKFYDHDVERLRWILLQQKEHFLPLKVIKDRLDESDDPTDEPGVGPPGSDSASPAVGVSDTTAEIAASHPGASTDAELLPPPVPSPPPISPAAISPPVPAVVLPPVPATVSPPVPAIVSPPVPAGKAADPERPVATPPAPGRPPEAAPDTLTLDELASAVGMDRAGIEELEQFGLVSPAGVVGGTAYFDHAALEVARTAAAFARHGVEARHLRAWRNGAEREAGMFEQIVMPLLRQRNPQARRQAEATLAELSGLGGELRAALVRQALRSIR